MEEEDKAVVDFLVDAEKRFRKPKKIKHKDVFPDGKKSKLSNKIKMNFSEEELKKMKVSELKKILKEHNVKGFSKMKKASLIEHLMKHSSGKKTKPKMKQKKDYFS